MKKIMIILLLILASANIKSSTQLCKLHVTAKGVRNSNGWVVCHLFAGEDGFPTDSKKALKYIDDLNIKDGQAQFLFENLEPGYYAFTVHHDENGNKKMDKNMFGFPKEGWACSRNAKGVLGIGIPSYEDAKFYVSGALTEEEVTINY